MKTVFLIYKPVLDYDESEESYCVCSTREQAQTIIDEWFETFEDIKNTLEGNINARNWGDYHKIHNIDAMYNIFLYYDWERYGKECLKIRTLPFFFKREPRLV